MSVVCPRCRRVNEPQAVYCGNCGTALVQFQTPLPPPNPSTKLSDNPLIRQRNKSVSGALGCLAFIIAFVIIASLFTARPSMRPAAAPAVVTQTPMKVATPTRSNTQVIPIPYGGKPTPSDEEVLRLDVHELRSVFSIRQLTREAPTYRLRRSNGTTGDVTIISTPVTCLSTLDLRNAHYAVFKAGTNYEVPHAVLLRKAEDGPRDYWRPGETGEIAIAIDEETYNAGDKFILRFQVGRAMYDTAGPEGN
ncbi:MAG: zinc ribbon domain-containing protein [Tepidisphaeraceae bacterium]